MRIIIDNQGNLPCNEEDVRTRPLGGVQHTLVQLARAFRSLGHQVIVIMDDPWLHGRGWHYEKDKRIFYQQSDADAVIFVNNLIPCVVESLPKSMVRVLWTHFITLCNSPQDAISNLDCVVTISQFAHDCVVADHIRVHVPSIVISHGINYSEYPLHLPRQRYGAIYSYTPQVHALGLLLSWADDLRRIDKRLRIRISSGDEIYWGHFPKGTIGDTAKEIMREHSDLFTHGYAVPYPRLMQLLCQARMHVLPFQEKGSFCLGLQFAQAAGCPSVSTAHGAFPEVAPGQCLVSLDENYKTNFLNEIDLLLHDDAYWKEKHQNGLAHTHRPEQSWKSKAQEWVSLFNELATKRRMQ